MLLKAVSKVGGFTAASRVLGLIREMLIAHLLGANWMSDAFLVAFKCPNFFRRFFAEGAFHAAFVPQFTGTLALKGQVKAQKLVNDVFLGMGVFLLGFVGIVELMAPLVIHILAPGFASTPERLELTTNLLRINFPFIFLISMATIFAGVLNSLHKFSAAAASPMILNIFMIAALVLCPSQAVYGLSWAVIGAGMVQWWWLAKLSKKQGYPVSFKKPTLTLDLKILFKRMVPGMVGASAMQLNIFMDSILASFLPIGSISYLYYADRLNQLPLSIFGIAIGTVLLPTLSKVLQKGDYKEAFATQEKALSLAWKLSLPSAFGLVTLAYPIITLIYGHGKFTDQAIDATAPTLQAFALGLPAYVLSKVFTSVFFAKKDTKTPVKIALFSVLINFILNLCFIFLANWHQVGMALATAMAAWVQVFGLGWRLYQEKLFKFSGFLISSMSISLISSLLMVLSLYFTYSYFQNLPELWQVLGLITLGLIVYGASEKTLNS